MPRALPLHSPSASGTRPEGVVGLIALLTLVVVALLTVLVLAVLLLTVLLLAVLTLRRLGSLETTLLLSTRVTALLTILLALLAILLLSVLTLRGLRSLEATLLLSTRVTGLLALLAVLLLSLLVTLRSLEAALLTLLTVLLLARLVHGCPGESATESVRVIHRRDLAVLELQEQDAAGHTEANREEEEENSANAGSRFTENAQELEHAQQGDHDRGDTRGQERPLLIREPVGSSQAKDDQHEEDV